MRLLSLQAMPNYPFEFACMPSMQALQNVHGTAATEDGEPQGFGDMHEAPTSPSGRATPGVMRSTDLSAQDAAEVLFTIAQSEHDGGFEDDGTEPARPLYAFFPQIDSKSLVNDPSGHNALLKCPQFHNPTAARPRGASPARDSAEAGTSEVADEQTVDGVPVDALGARGVRPMIAQWSGAAAAAATGGMTPLAMTPHGLVPLIQGGQQFLMPVQTMKGPDGEEVTVAVPQGTPGHSVGLVLAPEGPLVLSSEDCRSLMVAGGGIAGEFVGLPADAAQGALSTLAVGHPSLGARQPGG
jgi:hypothetical protein